jgi:membrane-associated protease RseP (regulator of RpoE activity)
MKKTLQTLFLLAATTTVAFAQTTDLSNCKKVCEKTVIVEKGPLIGVRFMCGTAVSKNAVILQILPNTAAQKYNLAVNDIIIAIDNQEITSNQQLMSLVAAHQPGDKVSLTYKHLGQVIIKDIIIGATHTEEVIVKECCEEVEEPTNPVSVFVSPNPTSSKLNVVSGNKIAGEVTINILDINGSLIKTVKHNNDGQLNLPINVSELPDGAYFLKLQSNSIQHVEKFFVKH